MQFWARPRLNHFALSAGYEQDRGWVEVGKLYYELWDLGSGHVEGRIGKLSAYQPHQGIGTALLQELHRRYPKVQQWWTTPHLGDGETFWPYIATKHGFAYAEKTHAERRQELFGTPPDAVKLLLWGLGRQRPGSASAFREVDADLLRLAGGEQAPLAELAARLDPAWAEQNRERAGWIAVYDNAWPGTLTNWLQQIPGLVGRTRLTPEQNTPA